MDSNQQVRAEIKSGESILGIELGSTRIKASLIDSQFKVVASGEYVWENKLIDGNWTYSLEEVWLAIQHCYQEVVKDVKQKYELSITTIASVGVSGMMHGYLAFDSKGEQLVPFRTWRNSTTEEASQELSSVFSFNIPQRWSVAHYYQAVLNQEPHVAKTNFLTTLSGYVHWQLTGEKVIGIGDASGMFPIDSNVKNYHPTMVQKFERLLSKKGINIKLEEIFPKVLKAGEAAGVLTDKGCRLLDTSGQLISGIPCCPPEGDAGTGMVATNSVAIRSANVSAGTSIFAMVVLEKELAGWYPEIDIVSTPSGDPVAMIHANNCSSEIDSWVALFEEVIERSGLHLSRSELFELLFKEGAQGDHDCGGILSYGFFAGENIFELNEGRPLLVRLPQAKFTLANFMKSQILSVMCTIKKGMEILMKENVGVDKLLGHGGMFKTKRVVQSALAAALETPVSVMDTASEGGAWGIALLASYSYINEKKTLSDYLNTQVFTLGSGQELHPTQEDIDDFKKYYALFIKGLSIERQAISDFY